MTPLVAERLKVRDFRNLEAVDLELGERFNVFSGANGQGKTNVLEAVYAACTTKSFRTAKPRDLVRFGQSGCFVQLSLREEAVHRAQSFAVEGATRVVRLDGKRPRSHAEYAVASPVVVFHPGETSLSMGPSGERRRLLDRIALYASPLSMRHAERYTRAMRSRQRLLDSRGEGARELDAFEAVMAEDGAALALARSRALAEIAPVACAAFAEIAEPGLVITLDYEPGGPPDRDALARCLAEQREVDRRRGGATRGPHRDDVAIGLAGHPARTSASQGQHRAIVLALKIAEIRVVGTARGARPLLLLDDVSSELDRERTAALFALLRRHEGQVLLTTTRPELIDTEGAGDRADFAVSGGLVMRAPSR